MHIPRTHERWQVELAGERRVGQVLEKANGQIGCTCTFILGIYLELLRYIELSMIKVVQLSLSAIQSELVNDGSKLLAPSLPLFRIIVTFMKMTIFILWVKFVFQES